jgi:hypothetical protein
VELAIEPLDDIEVGAWAAKSNGILQITRKGLHFELPGDGIMASARHREVYTPILADLYQQSCGAIDRCRLGKCRAPVIRNIGVINTTQVV